MAGLWPSFLALLACLTGCIAIQSPSEWPSWVKLPKKAPAGNSKKPKESSSLARNAMTSATPKPKPLFSDVDDVDFEPQGLTEAAQNEKTRDWDSEMDDREEKASVKCGDTWKDLDMHEHDPRNPCVPHPHIPCVIADENVMPEQGKFRQLAETLLSTNGFFDVACHGSKRTYGCDPMAGMLKKWGDDLKISFDDYKKNPQSHMWKFQKFAKWLMNRSEETSFHEFWDSLEKKDYKAVSHHTLAKMKYDPFKEHMGESAEDYFLECADHDESGDISYAELQQFCGAIATMSNMPLQTLPACAKHQGFRKFEVDSHKLMEWCELYHEPFDDNYFGRMRYDHPRNHPEWR